MLKPFKNQYLPFFSSSSCPNSSQELSSEPEQYSSSDIFLKNNDTNKVAGNTKNEFKKQGRRSISAPIRSNQLSKQKQQYQSGKILDMIKSEDKNWDLSSINFEESYINREQEQQNWKILDMMKRKKKKCNLTAIKLEQSYLDRDRKDKEKTIISEQKKKNKFDFYSWRRDKFDNFVQYNQDEGEQVTDQKKIRQFIDIEVKVMKNRQFFQRKKVELWRKSFEKVWDNQDQLFKHKIEEQKTLIREEESKKFSELLSKKKKQIEDDFSREKAARLQKWQKESLKDQKQKIKKQCLKEFMEKTQQQVQLSILEQKQKNQQLELRKEQLKQEILTLKQKFQENEDTLKLYDQNITQTTEKFTIITKQILELIDKQTDQLPQLRQYFEQNDVVVQDFEGYEEELEYAKEQLRYIFHFIHKQKRDLKKMEELKRELKSLSEKKEKLVENNHKNGKKVIRPS